ncbi:hypothetical protein KXX16_006761 [Aspergillus fumigatus]|nr:hypothetical protein KXX49_004744 [Aspergillus fumigatus]KAH1651435.1 hypothetical protein KXX16_006761 [Aspergillus fumigatus]KAH1962759.1 hypothetical protein KXV90_003650 [Aspergillus fumigatus]KAH2011114.1 hypothetical protein KXV97_009533 [Aspergillus fumigatus]KAH2034259.1 hypothetical protein KXV65_002995 [Aspergillus fumigatus]
MDQFERLRAVGLLESYSTARHHLKFYLNVSVAATYILPETYNSPVKDYIYRACTRLINQHPILSAIPVGEGTKEPYFARLPEVDLEKSVSFEKRARDFPEADEPDTELETLLTTQHNTPFTPPLPYWRLCVLTDATSERRFTAAFVYHHAISDGTSGKAFHKTFLQALRETAGSVGLEEVKTVIAPPKVPLLPNSEAVHPLPVSIFYLATTLFKEKVWSWSDPGLWTGSGIIVPLETQLRHIVFSEHVTSVLKDRCRHNYTTITAMLETAIARSLFARLPEKFTSVKCTGAMSTRRWLDDIITDDSMGVWVQDFEDTFSRNNVTSDGFPWEEARRARQTIENVLSLKGKNASPNLLKYVDDVHDLFLSKVGKARKSSFEVSNVGVLAADQDTAKPQIERMVFSQSASVTGNAFEVSVITGGDRCMVLAFTWQTHVVESDLMSAVIESIRTELVDLCS